MFKVCQLLPLLIGVDAITCAAQSFRPQAVPPPPPRDERKTSADAARSRREDGIALASSPRVVIRGENCGPDRLALLQVRDGA